MPFVSDNSLRTTRDTENGMELFPSGGSSDGTRRFVIIAKEFTIRFSAFIRDYENQDDTGTNGDRPVPDFVWEIRLISMVGSLHRNDVEKIVIDAMISYKFAHGYPENQSAAVVVSDGRFKTPQPLVRSRFISLLLAAVRQAMRI